jgi:prepilin-type N-terminal cleavage/methylation domain-containing protein
MKNKINYQEGFTLIETLMAMAIFTIGILGLFGMQTAVIKQNLAANTITTGATWAADQVERLIGLPYSHPDISPHPDNHPDNLADCQTWDDAATFTFDNFKLLAEGNGYTAISGTIEPIYTIYWNVAQNCTMTDIPDADERPKHIRIISTRTNDNGEIVEAAVFNYIKQADVRSE